MKIISSLLLTVGFFVAAPLQAALKVPAIIGDHMVLQQNQANPIWGWDSPGTNVTVTFAGQTQTVQAGTDGKWTVKLAPLPVNDQGQDLTIEGSEKKEIHDVLVGEVWMCSGQSNMGFVLRDDYYGDLEAAGSKLPKLRLIKVPNIGTQELKNDFTGSWKLCTPESAAPFSAVGFMFGKRLHEILGVPVGLIDNAWGGSAAEAWIRRETLESEPRFKRLMEATVQREQQLQSPEAVPNYNAAMEKWNEAAAQAKAEGKPAPRRPESPQGWLNGNARPGNIFNGVVNPTLGYGIKGIIWYQGEANVGRAYEYADLFPFMIQQWRKEWGQGEFPFYWVQLANFLPRQSQPGDSAWAELRESQTKTLKLPNTGQAVIIDLGEGSDIHPRNKHDVAARLVRWALVRDYGMKFAYRSPEFKSMEINGNKAVITLDCFGSSLHPFGVNEAVGFQICGADKAWKWANGRVLGSDKVEVSSDGIESPVAVRYAWADNPACNLYSKEGLPVTPFRTDDFDMITKPQDRSEPK